MKRWQPYLMMCLAFLVAIVPLLSIQMVHAELPQLDQDLLNLDADSYRPNSGKCGGGAQQTQLDISTIVSKYGLHSALVKQIGGNALASSQPDTAPVAVASVLKLVIADVFLNGKPDLGRTVTVTAQENYFGPTGGDGSAGSPKTGQNIVLGDALEQMLKFSSDTDANVLIDAAGGLQADTATAGTLGYSSTSILSYYNDAGASTIAPNSTTVTDLTKAMEKIYTSSDPIYQKAHGYLSEDTVKFGLSSEANKWGGTSKVTGNSAVFASGDQHYIITLYIEKDWKGDKDGTNPDSGASAIKGATTDILSALQSAATPSAASPSTQCCASTVSGADNESKVWNYLVGQMSFTSIQSAGIMGNMQQESNFNPTDTNPQSGAYGIAQWFSGRLTALEQFAQQRGTDKSDMATQLDYLRSELEGPYKSKVLDPIKASSDLGQVTRIWLEYFEIPCSPPGHACDSEFNIRFPNAQDILTRLGSGNNAAPAGGAGGCSGGGTFSYGKYAALSRDELIKIILNAANWRPQSQNPVNDIQSGVAVDNLLRLIAALVENLPGELITPSVIQTGHDCHSSSGNISNHMGGLAVDLGGAGHSPTSMNTIFTWLYTNAAALGVNELIFDPVPPGTSTLLNGQPFIYDGSTRQEHQNHIHVSVQGPRPTSCPPGT